MKFWHDGQNDSTRLRNVDYCWKELKKLSDFLSKNGISCSANLYDFSCENNRQKHHNIIPDSIHIPYPIGVYKKAEKTNVILNQQKTYDFFMMLDCDTFFHENDYGYLLNLILSLNKGDVITFDMAKLEKYINEYMHNNIFMQDLADWSFAYSGEKLNGPLNGYTGGLGGVYICDTYLLLSLGGFNEKYVGWGGEDGEMLDRIMCSKEKYQIRPQRSFFPFHLPHFSDHNNPNYNQRFNNE